VQRVYEKYLSVINMKSQQIWIHLETVVESGMGLPDFQIHKIR